MCFAAGAALGTRCGFGPGWPLVLSGASLIGMRLCIWRGRRAGVPNAACAAGCVLAWMAVTAAAWAAAGVCALERRATAVNFPAAAGTVEVVGMVQGEPAHRRRSKTGSTICEFSLRLDSVRFADGDWRPARGRIGICSYGDAGRRFPEHGERWYMRGTPRRFAERGGGRSRTAERSGLTTLASRMRRLAPAGPYDLKACSIAARRAAARRLAAGIEEYPEAVGVLHALLPGYRTGLSQRAREMFVATGTLHIFAISGLHVGMIAGLVVFLLRALRVPRMHWVFFLAPILVFYTLATGAKASAVRACIMAVIYFLAPLAGRRPDAPSALALAALLILGADPQQIGDLAFVFSFSVVAGLLALYPHMERLLCAPWGSDPFRATPRIEWARRVGRRACCLAALSLSAWLVSAPLTAYVFGRFSPVGLFSNVLVIPLASLIVLSGVLSLVLGSCWAALGTVFNNASLALIAVLMRCLEGLWRLPVSNLEVARPPLAGVLAWYVLLGTAALLLPAWPARNPSGVSAGSGTPE